MATRRPVGQPTKYTAEIAAKLAEYIQAGNTIRCAAGCVGITERTFYNWRDRYPAFAAQVQQSEDKAEAFHVTALAVAAKAGDWRASESWLKRRRRADWGDHVVIEGFDPAALSDAELEEARTSGKVKLEMVG